MKRKLALEKSRDGFIVSFLWWRFNYSEEAKAGKCTRFKIRNTSCSAPTIMPEVISPLISWKFSSFLIHFFPHGDAWYLREQAKKEIARARFHFQISQICMLSGFEIWPASNLGRVPIYLILFPVSRVWESFSKIQIKIGRTVASEFSSAAQNCAPGPGSINSLARLGFLLRN